MTTPNTYRITNLAPNAAHAPLTFRVPAAANEETIIVAAVETIDWGAGQPVTVRRAVGGGWTLAIGDARWHVARVEA